MRARPRLNVTEKSRRRTTDAVNATQYPRPSGVWRARTSAAVTTGRQAEGVAADG
ncbi:MAG: hypothetical protein M3Y36_08205 [Actinomycetota bacterium]|nr:hypothetical protein [Actinomycetota bacterium]